MTLRPIISRLLRRSGLVRNKSVRLAIVALIISAIGGAGYLREKPADTRDQAGDFDYLTLVLSWSPTFCRANRDRRQEPQCGSQRPYAFVLHGLWPQYHGGWPSNCQTDGRPWVPNEVIRSMLDIMPSRRLIIHEYKKHGTCSGLSAKKYFRLARDLYERIKIPPRYVLPRRSLQTSPREIENDFLKANPNLSAEMISISCGKGNNLQGIRICYARGGDPARCGNNEDQRRLCSKRKIFVPPVRTNRPSASQ